MAAEWSKTTGTVLVCPLDWGLGHASRMIPVIRHFQSSNSRVILAGSGKSGDLLKIAFPELTFVHLPAPEILYTANSRWMIPKLLWQLPRMLISAFREHSSLRALVKAYQVETVVSDNRYGLFHKKAHCIFVTHQISPMLPAFLKWAEFPVHWILNRVILQYNECWIPDYSDPMMNLSGRLSHRYRIPRNTRFIGILSRFDRKRALPMKFIMDQYDCVFVVSGPEPQCSIFSSLCIELALQINRKSLIISGMREEIKIHEIPRKDLLTIVPHLNQEHFQRILLQAGAIICRAGYSGIMDLVALQRTALLVPTPGQPEQEYLAQYLADKGLFSQVRQHNLNAKSLMDWLDAPGISFDYSMLKGEEDFR
jgi:predicted glycosyltransferase